MVSLQSLIFTHHNTPILSLNKRTNNHHHHVNNSSACIVRAMENDDDDETYVNQFEIDPDEAKQALQQLDQQLKSFSKKQTNSPRIKVKITRGPMEQETLEISGSFLTNTAVALLIFTIFYNVLFYAVIKPSIDGPDDISVPTPAPAPAAATVAAESPDAAVNKESPPPLLQD